MVSEHVITSLSGYVSILEKLSNAFLDDSRRSDIALLFRGQSDSSYGLLPSIARGGAYQGWDSLLGYEGGLIAAAKHRIPGLFKETLSPIDLLALMQHYGIPTRLLDVTENPLAAAKKRGKLSFSWRVKPMMATIRLTKPWQIPAICSEETRRAW